MALNFFKINKGISLAPQSADPTVNNSEGDTYYNSTTHTLRQYQNGAWADVGASQVDTVNIITTAAGTTSLAGTVTIDANLGKDMQIFTGNLSQIVKTPDATTMKVGQKIEIYNESSGQLTIQFHDATSFTDASGIGFATIFPHQSLTLKVQTNATTNGTWAVLGNTGAGLSLVQPTVQKFLSGTGTYTTPANVAYIEIEMVGGGAGGTGSGSSSGGTGGTGGNTTFGTSLLTATGGSGTPWNGLPGAGGTATINSPAIQVVAVSGGTAGFGGTGDLNSFSGAGGVSPLGGNGPGVAHNFNTTAPSAQANTGSGGAGAGGSSLGGQSGGSAGAYLKAIIVNPSSTYSYAVGSGGAGGTPGSTGNAAGTGGSGMIAVTEYYNQTIASGVTVTSSTAPTKQVFLSGTGTYTRPSGVQFIEVEMVGAGGGGAGSGSSGGTGGTGGNSTFGTSLLVANGGSGGTASSYGGDGGTASLGTGPIGTALQGGKGSPGTALTSSGYAPGGNGAPTAFGGAGGGGGVNGAGIAAIANTGSGGGGAGTNNATGAQLVSGGGGGAGGYVKAIITNPLSTYAYGVGAAGTAGTAGSNSAGAAGGSGLIVITEYYAAFATGGFSGGGANVPTVQKFLSGSGTYTTPANVLYIQVKMVGGGGGGGGGGNSAGTSAAAGGITTFGTSLLTANGGGFGQSNSQGGIGGVGGTASVTTSTTVLQLAALQGGYGSGNNAVLSTAGAAPAVPGPSTPFGGGGGAMAYTGSGGQNSPANTGSGGAGGGPGSTEYSGASGGAGGYIEAIITNPLATYAYAVGAAGTAGSGTGGGGGGGGGSGYLEITEYYANGAVGTATNITGIAATANGGTGRNGPCGVIVVGTQAAYSTGNVPILFPAALKDTHGAYNPSTGQFTAPFTGFYVCSSSNSTTSSGANVLNVYVNSARYMTIGTAYNAGGALGGTGTVFATAGQTIDFRYEGTWTAVDQVRSGMSIVQIA